MFGSIWSSDDDLTVATDGLRKQLVDPAFLKMSPLRVYAIASRFELDEEATIAAKATLYTGLRLPLHEDLKGMTGYTYHRLVLLHERRARDAIALLPDKIEFRGGFPH